MITQKANLSAMLFCMLFFGTCVKAETQAAIRLEHALKRSLQSNAALQQYPFQQQQSAAFLEQAKVRPQPSISLEVENVLGSGNLKSFDSAESTLMLSQNIELGDKRHSRMTFATAERQQEQAEYEMTRLDVLAETSRRYYKLLRLQSLDVLLGTRITQEKAALALLTRRAKAGAVSEVDVAKMSLHLEQSKVQRSNIKDEYQLAQLQLSSMWQAQPDFEHAAGDITHLPLIPSKKKVLSNLEKSPEMLLQQALVRLADGKTLIENSLGRADLSVGVGVKYVSASDDVGLTFQASMPLNFSNPNRGRIQAAAVGQRKSAQQRALAFEQLKLQLLEIQQRTTILKKQVLTIKNQLLPKAKTLLSATEKVFGKGQVSVLQWADTEDEVFALEQALIEKNTLIYLNMLELERVTGLPMLSAGE